MSDQKPCGMEAGLSQSGHSTTRRPFLALSTMFWQPPAGSGVFTKDREFTNDAKLCIQLRMLFVPVSGIFCINAYKNRLLSRPLFFSTSNNSLNSTPHLLQFQSCLSPTSSTTHSTTSTVSSTRHSTRAPKMRTKMFSVATPSPVR